MSLKCSQVGTLPSNRCSTNKYNTFKEADGIGEGRKHRQKGLVKAGEP